MAIKRFCDWCNDEVKNHEAFFYATLEPSDNASYRSRINEKQVSEICTNCMTATIEFVKTRKAK